MPPSLNVQLENRTVVLARAESTYGVDAIAANFLANANPSSFVTDALLCDSLDIKANTNVLERLNYSPSLSRDTVGMGRMLLQTTFQTEFRGSGVFGTPPRIDPLLKACGMARTTIANTLGATIGSPVSAPTNTSAGIAAAVAAVTRTTQPTKCFDTYRITYTLGGAPGTARYVVTGGGFPDGDTSVLNSMKHSAVTNSKTGTVTVGGTLIAPTFTLAGTWVVNDYVEIFIGGVRFFYQAPDGSQTSTTIATALAALAAADARLVGTAAAAGVITVTLAAGAAPITSSASAQPVTLGQSGAVVSIGIYSGTITAGEYFEITLLRPGVRYDPISDNFGSVTLWVYMDGTLQRLRGSRGTFSIEGAAAQYSKISWTFTSLYDEPVDQALPTGLVFEDSIPWKVELAGFQAVGIYNAGASKFSFDMANTVTPKEDINEEEGYSELRVTERTPVIGADPQVTKPSEFSPWSRARRADVSRFHVSLGSKGGAGNICRIQADRTNFSEVPMAARERIKTFDFKMRCARITAAGNDEVFLHFG